VNNEIADFLAKASRFLVDGMSVNPWLARIDFESAPATSYSVELKLDLAILIFELKQHGVSLTRDTVRQFVMDDVKNHGEVALDGYLTILRYTLNPPPRRKNFGWFARMFTSPPKWTPPTPQWKWTSVDDISLSNDDALVIRGKCCLVATQ
jgi:hypothetical protein